MDRTLRNSQRVMGTFVLIGAAGLFLFTPFVFGPAFWPVAALGAPGALALIVLLWRSTRDGPI